MPHTIRLQVARARRLKRWEPRVAVGLAVLIAVLVLLTAIKEGW